MIIYFAYNTITNKYYVGKTIYSIEDRWKQHCWDASHKPESYFHRAIKKYGKEMFQLGILAKVSSEQELNNLEKIWILLLESNNSKFGYNMTSGGEGISKGDTEVCRRISETLKRKYKSGEIITSSQGCPKGRSHTDDEKRKIGNAHRGKVVSIETRAKIRISRLGKSSWNKGLYGRKDSNETKLKKSYSMLGKNVGKTHSEQSKLAMRKAWVLRKQKRQVA